MNVGLMIAVTLAAALDISSFYLLGLRGASELNPAVLFLGPIAVIAKLALAAGIVWALSRRARYAVPVGTVAAVAWAFGAATNLM